MVSPRARTGLAAVAAVACLTACTSSDPSDGDRGTTPPPTSSPTPTSTPTPTATSATSSDPAPAALAAVDGAYVLAGPTPDDADVYRVVAGRLQRVTTGEHVSTVSDDGRGIVVVGREQGGAELVQRLRSGRTSGLGIDSGFSPAVSAGGALAWVSLGGAGSTPGVSKPSGFVVHVRSSLSGRDRQVATFASSVGGLQWSADGLVAAVAAGGGARLVRIPTNRGTPRTLATIAEGDDLEVTAGADAFTVSSGDGAVVVSGSRQHRFAAGWRPLCWSGDDTVLAARAGRLATVAIDGTGRAATPRVLGSLPAGTGAYGGSCAGT